MIKAEQETIIRWDQAERVLNLYTAYSSQARRWERLGYVVEVSDRSAAGEPRGWRARAPLNALRWRRLEDGKVVSRRRGRSIGFARRKLARVEDPLHLGSAPMPEHRDSIGKSAD